MRWLHLFLQYGIGQVNTQTCWLLMDPGSILEASTTYDYMKTIFEHTCLDRSIRRVDSKYHEKK